MSTYLNNNNTICIILTLTLLCILKTYLVTYLYNSILVSRYIETLCTYSTKLVEKLFIRRLYLICIYIIMKLCVDEYRVK